MRVPGRGAPLWFSALVISLLTTGACTSKGSLTEPSSPTTSNSAVRGTVTEALTGAPIDGATVSFSTSGASHALTTSGGGVWQVAQGQVPANVLIEVAAPGYVTRRTHLHSVMKNGEASFDLIRDAAPFSLDFYRQLIRNQLDAPGTLPALRRWTKNPAFYINTKNPRTGQDLTSFERDAVRGILHASIPHMTGGQLSASGIEFGSGPRPDKAGLVTVGLVDEPGNQFCGWSRVGSDPGAITLNVASHCDTPCGAIAPRTLAHEVGHALGFYHVARGDVLSTNWSRHDCGSITLSAAEQHHARLAYSRLPGNRDADYDPLSTLLAQPAETPVVIGCK